MNISYVLFFISYIDTTIIPHIRASVNEESCPSTWTILLYRGSRNRAGSVMAVEIRFFKLQKSRNTNIVLRRSALHMNLCRVGGRFGRDEVCRCYARLMIASIRCLYHSSGWVLTTKKCLPSSWKRNEFSPVSGSTEAVRGRRDIRRRRGFCRRCPGSRRRAVRASGPTMSARFSSRDIRTADRVYRRRRREGL